MTHNLKPYEPQFEDHRGDEDDLRLKWDAVTSTLSIVNHKGQQPWTRGAPQRGVGAYGTSLLRLDPDGQISLFRYINKRIAKKAGLPLDESNRLVVRVSSGDDEQKEEEVVPEYTGEKTFPCKVIASDTMSIEHDTGDAIIRMSSGRGSVSGNVIIAHDDIDSIIEQLKAVKAEAYEYIKEYGDEC